MSYVDVLSKREAEVVALLGHGLTVSEIARDLGLNVKTVSTFRSRALAKLANRGLIEKPTTAAVMRLVIRDEMKAAQC
jgi:DNA-binding NarL/FixJ family response regulator